MNGYTVTVENLTGGWTLSSTSDPTRPRITPAGDVLLADGLVFGWSFVDGRIPNPLEPATIQVPIIARSAANMPAMEVGDLLKVTIDLVDVTGATVTDLAARAVEFIGRTAEPEVELVPGHSWPVRIRLTASDLLADLRSRFPRPGPVYDDGAGQTAASTWLEVWAEERARLNLWSPKRWRTEADTRFQLEGIEFPDASAYEQLAQLAAGWPDDDGGLYVVRPRYDESGAAPDPATWNAAGFRYYGATAGDFPDTTNPIGYLFQRLNRETPAGSYLPFVLTGPAAGTITIAVNVDPAAVSGVAVVPAAAVTIPTKARRTRDSNVNTFVLGGRFFTLGLDDDGVSVKIERGDTTTEISTDPTAPRTRQVQTLTVLRRVSTDPANDGSGTSGYTYDQQNEYTRVRLAKAYTVDTDAVSAEWSYSELELITHDLPSDVYAALLPLLTSWAPEQGDGVPVRPVVVYDVDPEVDLSGMQFIAGSLVASSLTIAEGRIAYQLQLTPGTMPPSPTSGAITAADLAASPYAATPASAFDPSLTALDMRLVRP